MNQPGTPVVLSPVVARDAWLTARRELLAREKALTQARDELAALRRQLPVVRVDHDWTFDGPRGRQSLRELFEGRPQLIVYHFMFAPEWDEGCPSCALVMDSLAGSLVHLAARDTSFVAISRAPLAKLLAYRERMGWTFPWVSSHDNGFNQAFQVTLDETQRDYNFAPADALPEHMPRRGELPGLSVFVQRSGAVCHSYSTYTRGLDGLMGVFNLLDLTPLGRRETPGMPMTWVRQHDEY
jgi:predicted dithiol-disulfide oxidoreductase (DUF899 family)